MSADKSPEAFRTISEVADALDVPPHVLRFWETRFAQVKPVKRGGGRRYYRPEDVRLLRGIRGLLYDDGMTIKGVQKILREKGVRHVIGLGTVGGEPEAQPESRPVTRAPAEPAEVTRAPAQRPAAAKRPAGEGARPQADLFGAEAAEVLTRAPAAEAGEASEAVERKSLKTLVGELEALRAAMLAGPER